MPTWEQLAKKRERFSERKQSALVAHVKRLQGSLYAALLDRIVTNLETDETGAIKFTAANIAQVGKVGLVFDAYRKSSTALGEWIVKGLVQLFGLNTAYMRAVSNVTDSLEDRSRSLLFRNLGYDLKTKEIIKDSWLDGLLAQDQVKQQVVNRLNAALQSKMDAKTFKTQFRDAFLDNKNGLGLVRKNMDFHTQNIFMSFDRASQEVYRDNLGLKYGLYSGTVMMPTKKSKGTRPFCLQRVGNIYSKQEIEKWRNLQFKGRVEPYNPFTDCGSINCRHHWNWISEEMKETLEKRGRKVDEYNPLPAYVKGR